MNLPKIMLLYWLMVMPVFAASTDGQGPVWEHLKRPKGKSHVNWPEPRVDEKLIVSNSRVVGLGPAAWQSDFFAVETAFNGTTSISAGDERIFTGTGENRFTGKLVALDVETNSVNPDENAVRTDMIAPVPKLLAADTNVKHWNGIFRDVAGRPLVGIEIDFWRPNGQVWDHRTVTTDATGKWNIDLPEGDWKGAAKPASLLARGYYCVPGTYFGGGSWGCIGLGLPDENGVFSTVTCMVENPPETVLWPGFVEWRPVGEVTLVGGTVLFLAVPTKPELSVERLLNGNASVSVAFETQFSLTQTLTRQWRVEKSTDLIHWVPMQKVALAGMSPIHIVDEAAPAQPNCYYRAAMVEDLVAQ